MPVTGLAYGNMLVKKTNGEFGIKAILYLLGGQK